MAWTEQIERIADALRPRLPKEAAGRLAPPPAWAPPTGELSSQQILGAIDHTLLKPTATADQIRALCAEAREHAFASVCVNSSWVPLCREELEGSPVAVCTVVGFPLGAMATKSKAFETSKAILDGAVEIDMVLAVGRLLGGDPAGACEDIAEVVKAAAGAPVKVILETSMLDDDQKIEGCLLAMAAEAAFVKTSTGFGGGGATEADIALMRGTVGASMEVKASGGVRDIDAARVMMRAGATRLGTSSGVAIAKGLSPSGPGAY